MAALSGLSSSSSHPSTTLPFETPRDKVLFNPNLQPYICLFSPNLFVVNMSLVNRQWRALLSTRTNEMNMSRKQCSQDVIDDFAPLVRHDLVSWKEVHSLYARLSSVVSSVIGTIYSSTEFRRAKNPILNASYSPHDLEIMMPGPFAQYGNYHFFIYNLTGIEVHDKRNQELFLLKGKSKKKLMHLAVDGNNVCALREDGIIDLWDYIKRVKVKKISTDYKKSGRRTTDASIFYKTFNIKNGVIVIDYDYLYRERIRLNTKKAPGINLLEIIPYENPKESQSIKDRDYPSFNSVMFMEVLEDKQIIMVVRNYDNKLIIFKMKLATHETDKQPSHHYSNWTALSQHSLKKFTDLYERFSIFHLKTKEETETSGYLENRSEFWDCTGWNAQIITCVAIENLVFNVFLFTNGELCVDVIKIDGEDACRIARLDALKDLDHSRLLEWKANILTQLVLTAQKELKKKIPPVADTPYPIVPGAIKELQFRSKSDCVIA